MVEVDFRFYIRSKQGQKMDQYLIDIMHQIDENHQKFQEKKFDEIVELTSIKNLPYEQKLNAIKLILTNTEVVDNASILNLH